VLTVDWYNPGLILLAINLFLLWLVMAAPVGVRTLKVRRRFEARPEQIWSAVDPLGENANWNPSILSSRPADADGRYARQAFDHLDRKGAPIERVIEISREDRYAYSARVVDDTALDVTFWAAFHERRLLRADAGQTVLVVEQTDRYRGIAFLIFRYFALRREMISLDGWLKTGKAEKVGSFERAPMQVFLALVSTLLFWPFFGLTSNGLVLSSILTLVIVLHELGHMAAYRAFGHRSARMIFIPLLGGIAIGGRPYNSHFEAATCALMGAGMSAFVVPIAIVGHEAAVKTSLGDVLDKPMLVFILILGGFNLLNLLPMARFDGGQVLRRMFPALGLQMLGSFGIAGVIAVTCWQVGVSFEVIIIALAVFTLLSMISAGTINLRDELQPMRPAERLLVGLGLYAAVIIHSYAIVYTSGLLFG
jgi:Zn-dependent protease